MCIEKEEEQEFYDDFLLCIINFYNTKIYVSCFYKYKIYIYDILLNQLQIIIIFNDEIVFGCITDFLNYKNI